MKKYRLIELGENYPQKLELFPSFDEAATAMRNLMGGNQNFYRIEEVEESIMNRVKSYEDACKVLGCKADVYKILIDGYEKYNNPSVLSHIIALLKLETITAALNEGWKPDWADKEQKKWRIVYPGDSKHNVYITHDLWGASFNPRLYFKSRELAEYAAKQFVDLYRQLLIEKF